MKLNSKQNEPLNTASEHESLKHGIINAPIATSLLTPSITSSRDLLVASLLQAT
jgi:hypothetical protein